MNSRSCIPQLRTGCGGQERRANRCAISLGQPHGHHFAAPPPRDRFAVAQGAHGLGWLDPARPGRGGRRPPGPGRHGYAGAAGPQRDEHPAARTCGARATRHGVLDGLIAQGLRTPKFLSTDGGAGLDRVLAALWRGVAWPPSGGPSMNTRTSWPTHPTLCTRRFRPATPTWNTSVDAKPPWPVDARTRTRMLFMSAILTPPGRQGRACADMAGRLHHHARKTLLEQFDDNSKSSGVELDQVPPGSAQTLGCA